MNAQPTQRKRRLGKILSGSFCALLAVYVGSYILNSLTGGWVVNESGKVRLMGGLANCDQYVWMPRYGFCQRFRCVDGRDDIRAGGLGHLYCPLILADQAYFHRTIRFMNEDMTFVEPLPVPPIGQYHPAMVNRFAGRFPYRPITNNTGATVAQPAAPLPRDPPAGHTEVEH